eukprot:1984750-Pleurochrysis_carterae.AAC.1
MHGGGRHHHTRGARSSAVGAVVTHHTPGAWPRVSPLSGAEAKIWQAREARAKGSEREEGNRANAHSSTQRGKAWLHRPLPPHPQLPPASFPQGGECRGQRVLRPHRPVERQGSKKHPRSRKCAPARKDARVPRSLNPSPRLCSVLRLRAAVRRSLLESIHKACPPPAANPTRPTARVLPARLRPMPASLSAGGDPSRFRTRDDGRILARTQLGARDRSSAVVRLRLAWNETDMVRAEEIRANKGSIELKRDRGDQKQAAVRCCRQPKFRPWCTASRGGGGGGALVRESHTRSRANRRRPANGSITLLQHKATLRQSLDASEQGRRRACESGNQCCGPREFGERGRGHLVQLAWGGGCSSVCTY